MKKIVINADDFGLCDSVNKGILYSMENGIVSDLSFIINQPYLNNSVELLKKKGIFDIGVHLNFTMGRPNLSKISSLTNSKGFFNNTQTHFANYLKGKLNSDDIYEEGKTQIEILISNGFNITHFDTHQNIHILPPFFEAINKLRFVFNPDGFIRIPFEHFQMPLNYKLSNLKRIFILNLFSAFIKGRFGSKNSIQTIGGDIYNNDHPEFVFKRILKNIYASKRSEFEIAVHPGYYSNDILEYDPYAHGRETELQFIANSTELLKNQNIKLVNFSNLILKSNTFK